MGMPLLKRTIMTAHDAGIRRFVVVLGYEAEQTRYKAPFPKTGS